MKRKWKTKKKINIQCSGSINSIKVPKLPFTNGTIPTPVIDSSFPSLL